MQHGDGREEALLNFIHGHANIASLRGSPSAIVAAMDEFGVKQDFLMTIGPAKREIITDILASSRPIPKVFLEFGTYVGYSAIALGSFLRDLHPDAKAGEIKYITLEREPLFAAITSSLVELAGLKDIVEVVVGNADESIRRMVKEGKLKSVDAILLDHWEDLYVSDLQVVEELGLLRKGSLVIADNVIRPGAPDYLRYVRAGKGKGGVEYTSREIESIMPMGIPVSTYHNGFGLHTDGLL